VKFAFADHARKLAASSLKSRIGHPRRACEAPGIVANRIAFGSKNSARLRRRV
jgi:hypothetical protein